MVGMEASVWNRLGYANVHLAEGRQPAGSSVTRSYSWRHILSDFSTSWREMGDEDRGDNQERAAIAHSLPIRMRKIFVLENVVGRL